MNKKGYLLSEVIISFSLSFIILVVIFNTTITLNKNLNNLYIENNASSQQIIFNMKVAEDFLTKTVSSMNYNETSKSCSINYDNGSKNYLTISDSYINYSKNADDSGEKIYLPKNMKIGTNIICEIDDNKIAKLIIPIRHSSLDKDYGVELYTLSSEFTR